MDVGLSETPSPQRRIADLEADVRRLTTALTEARTDADKWHDVGHRMHRQLVHARYSLDPPTPPSWGVVQALAAIQSALNVWKEAT